MVWDYYTTKKTSSVETSDMKLQELTARAHSSPLGSKLNLTPIKFIL